MELSGKYKCCAPGNTEPMMYGFNLYTAQNEHEHEGLLIVVN